MTTDAERIVELEERVSTLERELSEREHVGRLFDLVDHLVPADVRGHLRAARHEQLLAVRAYLDRLIDRTEPSDEKHKKSGHRRIEVE